MPIIEQMDRSSSPDPPELHEVHVSSNESVDDEPFDDDLSSIGSTASTKVTPAVNVSNLSAVFTPPGKLGAVKVDETSLSHDETSTTFTELLESDDEYDESFLIDNDNDKIRSSSIPESSPPKRNSQKCDEPHARSFRGSSTSVRSKASSKYSRGSTKTGVMSVSSMTTTDQVIMQLERYNHEEAAAEYNEYIDDESTVQLESIMKGGWLNFHSSACSTEEDSMNDNEDEISIDQQRCSMNLKIPPDIQEGEDEDQHSEENERNHEDDDSDDGDGGDDDDDENDDDSSDFDDEFDLQSCPEVWSRGGGTSLGYWSTAASSCSGNSLPSTFVPDVIVTGSWDLDQHYTLRHVPLSLFKGEYIAITDDAIDETNEDDHHTCEGSLNASTKSSSVNGQAKSRVTIFEVGRPLASIQMVSQEEAAPKIGCIIQFPQHHVLTKRGTSKFRVWSKLPQLVKRQSESSSDTRCTATARRSTHWPFREGFVLIPSLPTPPNTAIVRRPWRRRFHGRSKVNQHDLSVQTPQSERPADCPNRKIRLGREFFQKIFR